ncbi:PhoH family protein [Hyphococcus sp.]|uniref:PhoH family protein n=1 Tax=Hyphococcus sp. TaxID=2038636 RepID=UPI0020861475|nr:MAG: phosphate starvation protein PhoH [Marinicaulis sp.]
MSENKPTNEIDHIDFDDNRLVASLSGEHDAHLSILEEALDVRINPRGNRFAVTGAESARARAIGALTSLYAKLARGETLGVGDVRAAAKLSETPAEVQTLSPGIKTPKRLISARTPNQAAYLRALASNDLTFGVGPAGTGKTYLAVAHAVSLLLSGQVERIILSRPALEAGERIGFLPGDMKEKVDPFLRPLYDALHDMMHADYVERRIAAGDIEIAPIAFMRGRTLARAAVILDEAQNATPAQMKMFLTRLGEGAHMAVTGDPTQTDLPAGDVSGLADALGVLAGVKGIAEVRFEASDVVRHPMVARIIEAYEKRSARK